MKNRKKSVKTVYLIITFLCFTLFFVDAGPIIEVDNAHVEIGSIRKEERKIIRHLFKVKNTGNEILRINRVKPG